MKYKSFYVSDEKQVMGICKPNCNKCHGRGVAGTFIANYQKLVANNVSDDYLQRDILLCTCAKFIKYKDIDLYNVDLADVKFEKKKE